MSEKATTMPILLHVAVTSHRASRRAAALLAALALPACGGGGGATGLPPPELAQLSAIVGTTAGGDPVTLTGTGFSPPVAVRFGAVQVPVVAQSATSATVQSPPAAAGPVTVTLTNPDGRVSNGLIFTYQAGGRPPPVLVSIHPGSGSTGGGDTVELGGTGFDVGTDPVVTFGGTRVPATGGGTATSINVITPPHGEGTVDVTLTNGDGQASTLVNGFTYSTPNPYAPTVRNVVNDATLRPSGSVAGGDAVTITGTNFAPGATVLFGAAAATDVAFVSTTTLTARTPLDQPAGTVDVTVALPGTGLAGTILRGFTFLLPAPHVVSFNVAGSPPAGGGLLLVKGLGLQAGATVTFDGVQATVTAFTPGVPVGAAELTVIVPPSPLLPDVTDGFVNVVVWNPDGQSSTLGSRISPDGTPWPANFHYGQPPVVTAVSPSTGTGLDVTVTGTGFSSDAAGVREGLQVVMTAPTSFANPTIRKCPNDADPACLAGVVSPSPTSILAAIPEQVTPGNYTLVVTNFDGQSATAPGVFVVP